MIAHDGKKEKIVRPVQAHEETLRCCNVVAAGIGSRPAEKKAG